MRKNETSSDDADDPPRGAGFALGDWLPVFFVLGCFILFLYWVTGSGGWPGTRESLGQFGDAFGALSALFNGLAFAGFFITLVLQGKQLALQRAEFRLQRDELALTRRELSSQATTMRRQQFEGTFFGALAVLARIEATMPFRGNNDRSLWGFPAFADLGQALRNQDGQILQSPKLNDKPLDARKSYLNWYYHFGRYVSPYFNTLQELLTLVDRSTLADRQTYANLVRASMTAEQLFLVLHHGALHRRDRPETEQTFRLLLEKFAFFNGFDETQFLEAGASRTTWLRATAFGPGLAPHEPAA
jgi:hypothetical protein